MYIDNITKEEENYINNILSDGFDEIKDLTKEETGINNINPNNTNMNSKIEFGDLNKHQTQSEIVPKSSALRDLINQLKQDNNYIFSSDDDTIDNHVLLKKTNQKKIKQQIDNFEESTQNFSSMKTQMNHIQNKINKLNTTMLTNRNDTTTNSISKINANNSNTKDKAWDRDREIETNRSYSYKIKQKKKLCLIDDTQRTSRKNMRHNQHHSNSTSTSNLTQAATKRIARKTNSIESINYNNHYKSHSKHKEANKDEDDGNSSFNQGSPFNIQSGNDYTLKAKTINKSNLKGRGYHQLSNRNNPHVSPVSVLGSQFFWKMKYEDLKLKHHNQLKEIAVEKKKFRHLEKTIKANKKKIVNYNTLINYNKQLIRQDEILVSQITESENIRKEQSKLIQSLQREIDMLRGDVDENNLNNIAEVYQDMKESLMDSRNQCQSVSSFYNSQRNNNK